MRRVGRIGILMLGIVRVARGVGWRRVWFYRFMCWVIWFEGCCALSFMRISVRVETAQWLTR